MSSPSHSLKPPTQTTFRFPTGIRLGGAPGAPPGPPPLSPRRSSPAPPAAPPAQSARPAAQPESQVTSEVTAQATQTPVAAAAGPASAAPPQMPCQMPSITINFGNVGRGHDAHAGGAESAPGIAAGNAAEVVTEPQARHGDVGASRRASSSGRVIGPERSQPVHPIRVHVQPKHQVRPPGTSTKKRGTQSGTQRKRQWQANKKSRIAEIEAQLLVARCAELESQLLNARRILREGTGRQCKRESKSESMPVGPVGHSFDESCDGDSDEIYESQDPEDESSDQEHSEEPEEEQPEELSQLPGDCDWDEAGEEQPEEWSQLGDDDLQAPGGEAMQAEFLMCKAELDDESPNLTTINKPRVAAETM